MIIILSLILPIGIAAYYHNTAKQYNKNSIGYAILGFFAPLFPMILFALFISIAHLILGHDPKFRIGKTFFTIGSGLYVIAMLLYPQYLKTKWGKDAVSKTELVDVLDQELNG